jgi:hypothetical protein
MNTGLCTCRKFSRAGFGTSLGDVDYENAKAQGQGIMQAVDEVPFDALCIILKAKSAVQKRGTRCLVDVYENFELHFQLVWLFYMDNVASLDLIPWRPIRA